MSNLIEHNAYRIFGLDNSSNQKDILKRYNEIINRLKIDDHPEYDLDINLPSKLRTEESVNDSLKRLQNVKNNIKEYFFWFQIADTVDEKALTYLKNKDFSEAILTWKSASDTNNSTSLFYKKNLTLLYCLMLLQEQNSTYLKESLSNWHEIVNSDKFWIMFTKSYGLNNEQASSTELISEFKKNVVKHISDIYTNLCRQHKNPKYVKDFQEIFGTHGNETEKSLLQPIYNSIYDGIEELKKIKISEDEEVHEDDITRINDIINSLGLHFDKLRKMGLYDDIQSKVVRDHAADTIRLISVLLYNNSTLLDDSIKLINIAIHFCGTESLKNKLETDLEQIRKNISEDDENSIALEIPGTFSSKPSVFKSRFVEYGNKKLFYKDITRISYHAVNSSINFIPTSQSYDFMIASDKEKISLSFSSVLYIGNKEKKDTWMKLIGLCEHLIEPLLVQQIVRRIFEKGETVVIGKVEFDKNGYSRSKFWGGKECVLWSDTIYVPQFNEGNVILFKNKDGVAKNFDSISMETPNAVVLSELLKACINEYAMCHQR